MKKFIPFILLTAFLFLPQSALAGSLTEGCFPVVYCPAGQDAYADSCKAELDSVGGVAPSCLSVHGAPAAGKSWAFSCDAGCYQKGGGGGGTVDSCPGGVMVPDETGECIIKLNVLDDTDDTLTSGNGAYKIWDGTALTEVVHLDNTGCTDDQMAISDSAQPSGWKCQDLPNFLDAVIKGIIDVMDTLLADLGVDAAVITDIKTSLYNLLGGGTPAEIAGYQSALASALDDLLTTGAVWMGTSAGSYNGNATGNGYTGADATCGANASVCTVEEILALQRSGDIPTSIGGDEKAWINGGPPGFNSAANDCKGWTSAETTALNAWGRYWNFDTEAGWADGCNLTHRFACCK